MNTLQLHHGDCLEVMRAMPSNSVDSIVTDPPYGLSFMGKKWDYDVPSVEIWAECLRVLKPGGHLLAFAGTRTQHRMAVRIEDAGFEIRDMIAWVYGSGFPKSLDVSKAIDKGEGFWRGRAGAVKSGNDAMSGGNYERTAKGDPVTAAAAAWQGWGTALKPALEPITVARKPLVGTVAANVLEHGTGGLNIDACRVGTDDNLNGGTYGGVFGNGKPTFTKALGTGRWPANLIHDGSDEVLAGFPVTGPSKASMRGVGLTGDDAKVYGKGDPEFNTSRGHNDNGGSAARFFYCTKASRADRNDGLPPGANFHPTVKPTDLMAYLCRLVTPPGGAVLDPFMGSGSTGKAAVREGFRFIGIEREADYLRIATARIEAQMCTSRAESEPPPQNDLFSESLRA